MTRRGKYTDRFEEVNYLFDDFVNAGAKIEWVSMPSGGVLFTFEQVRMSSSVKNEQKHRTKQERNQGNYSK